MTGTKHVVMYTGIRAMLDFLSNRQGIGVIIILITEKLLHKTSFYISVFVYIMPYTRYLFFMVETTYN